MEFIEKHKGKILIIITFIMIIVISLTSFYKNRMTSVGDGLLYNNKTTFVGDMLGYVVTPIQKYLGKFSGWIENKIEFWKNADKLSEENKEFIKQIEILQTDNNRLKLYETENKKLVELLDLQAKYPKYETKGAEVIAKDLGNWYDTFTIDKGNKDSFETNMVVLAQTGLVGKIIDTGANFSKVVSIIDDRSSVSAKNTRTGDIGVVKGDFELRKKGLCKMEYIDADAEIIVGDEIITSHLSDIYPSGITIGNIKEIKTDNNGLTKYAIIEPVVDFKHIESVLIIDRKDDYFSVNTEE